MWQRVDLRLVGLLLVAALLLGLFSTLQSSRTVQRWLHLLGPEENGSRSALDERARLSIRPDGVLRVAARGHEGL